MLPSGASRAGEALDLSPSSHASDEPGRRSAGDAQVPHDLQGLAALLKETLPGQPPVVDLQGRTLSGQLSEPYLFLYQPGLILRNGTLQLPPRVCMDIGGDGVQLQELTITREAAGAAARTIFITAKQVIIKDCKIKYYELHPSKDCSKMMCHTTIYAIPGSSVSVLGCVIIGAPGTAVFALGPNCSVEVHNSHVHNNQGPGFRVGGAGGVLSIGAHCIASKNDHVGFYATTGGKLVVGDGCKAVGSVGGFQAVDERTRMQLGRGCRAERNAYLGFASADGAKMFVGDRCEATSNGSHGFCCMTESGALMNSQMVLGHGCRAVCNDGAGVVVAHGGTIVTGQGCIASSNKEEGFLVMHQGSRLRVGANSKAVGNKKKGFFATQAGRLDVEQGCIGL